MGFTLQLAHDLVEVEAGGNSPVTVIVTNRGETSDRFEMEIEGLDQDWKAIPVPVFTSEAGETRSERAFLKPPRASESGAGNYPFVVTLRSLDSGEQKSVQGVLQLKPFHSLTLEISPKKGVHSWSTHRNRFDVSITNLGNTEHTLQLVGNDPEDACTYEFEHERVTVGPGQQKEISVEVRPVSSPILGGSKLIGFSIHARSVDVPSVVASGQAQLEKRSLLSPANLTVLFLFVVLCSAWYLMRPKPPTVDFQVSTREAMPGDTVTLSWTAHDANHVKITAVYPPEDKESNQVVLDTSEVSSTLQVPLSKFPGTETFFVEVSKGTSKSSPVTRQIKIDTPAPPVIPKIISFDADKAGTKDKKTGEEIIRLRVPGSIVFSWNVEDAIGIALQPDFNNLVPGIQQQSVDFTNATDKTYQLVVWSKDRQNVYSKKIHVVAYEESDANIVSFTADKTEVPEGSAATLSWNVVNAITVRIKHDGITDSPVSPADSKSYPITKDTTFVLEALDTKNRIRTGKVVVKVQIPVIVPSTAGADNTTQTTAGTTGITPAPSTSGGDTGPPPGN